jgi:hypothetical protein
MNVSPGTHRIKENAIHIKKNEFDGPSLFSQERRWFFVCAVTWIIAGRFHSGQIMQ